jgi:ribonuclease HI
VTSRSAHVYTDGCRSGQDVARGCLAPGGWAAIVEKGSDGRVLRGGDPATTNVRMELVAMVEGLRALPDGCGVVLHTDATIATTVRQRWLAGIAADAMRGKDVDLWRQLVAQFERLDVGIDLIGKRDKVSQHRRAHLISREEAVRAGGRVVVGQKPSKARRRAAAASTMIYRHVKGCSAAGCVYWCPIEVFARSMG